MPSNKKLAYHKAIVRIALSLGAIWVSVTGISVVLGAGLVAALAIGVAGSGGSLAVAITIAYIQEHKPKATRRSYLIDLLIPLKIQHDVQVNLAECMPKWIEAHGQKRAQRIRQMQVLLIIGGYYGSFIRSGLGKVLNIIAGR